MGRDTYQIMARASDRRVLIGAASLARIFLLPNTTLGKGNAMQENQRVADMAVEVLARQAEARAQWTGEPLDEALKAVLETEAGQQLTGLRDGPHRDEEAKRWHDELAPRRAKKRRQARQEERSKLASLAQHLARPDAACEHSVMQATLRKEGELAGRRQTPGRYE